jgi:hypothetical protein
MITLLHWPSECELKPDRLSLTEASATRYLEELLTYTRRIIERKRTFSSTSEGSALSEEDIDAIDETTECSKHYKRNGIRVYELINSISSDIIIFSNRSMQEGEESMDVTVFENKDARQGIKFY